MTPGAAPTAARLRLAALATVVLGASMWLLVVGGPSGEDLRLLNYVAGGSGMPTPTDLAATAVGIIPGTLAYTAVGHTSGRPGSAPFVVSLTALALVTVLAAAAARRGPGPAAR